MYSVALAFQKRYLIVDDKDLSSREFLCPLGLRAAVKRKEVIVALEEDRSIVGIARIYISKRHGHASLYQFAINEDYRKTGLLKKMLNLVSNPVVSG